MTKTRTIPLLTYRQSFRFWGRIEVHQPSGCWTWQGYVDSQGYGRVWLTNSMYLAHRVAYEKLIGPIPDGLTLDHLCRNRVCVNPDHLRACSHKDNMARGIRARSVYCKHGHVLAGANVVVCYDKRGKRRKCVTCARERGREGSRRYRQREKEMTLPALNQSDPARPVQYEQIKRKARDAGLTQHELDILCQHAVNCDYSTLSVMQATQVLAFLIATGPDRAKWRINEMTGQRGFL